MRMFSHFLWIIPFVSWSVTIVRIIATGAVYDTVYVVL